MKRTLWIACAALLSAWPASAAPMSDVRAFLKSAEGSWHLSLIGTDGHRTDTRKLLLEIKADGDDAWLVSYDDCNIPDPADNRFGDCLGDRDRYQVMGLELRNQRGEQLTVARANATALEVEDALANGDVIRTRYELLFGGRMLERLVSRERNGVPDGAPVSSVLGR